MRIVGIVLLIIVILSFIGLALEKDPEKKKEFDKNAKVGFTVILIISLGMIFYTNGSNENLKKTTVAINSNDKIKKDAETKVAAEQETKLANKKKQQAKHALTAFTKVQNNFDDIVKSYQGEVLDMSNGSIDEVTAYSDIDKLEQQSMQVFNEANNLKVASQYNENKDTLVTAASYLQNSLNEFKTYFDSKKISDLADSKNDLQEAIKSYQLVLEGVTQQVIKDGYKIPTKQH